MLDGTSLMVSAVIRMPTILVCCLTIEFEIGVRFSERSSFQSQRFSTRWRPRRRLAAHCRLIIMLTAAFAGANPAFSSLLLRDRFGEVTSARYETLAPPRSRSRRPKDSCRPWLCASHHTCLLIGTRTFRPMTISRSFIANSFFVRRSPLAASSQNAETFFSQNSEGP